MAVTGLQLQGIPFWHMAMGKSQKSTWFQVEPFGIK